MVESVGSVVGEVDFAEQTVVFRVIPVSVVDLHGLGVDDLNNVFIVDLCLFIIDFCDISAFNGLQPKHDFLDVVEAFDVVLEAALWIADIVSKEKKAFHDSELAEWFVIPLVVGELPHGRCGSHGRVDRSNESLLGEQAITGELVFFNVHPHHHWRSWHFVLDVHPLDAVSVARLVRPCRGVDVFADAQVELIGRDEFNEQISLAFTGLIKERAENEITDITFGSLGSGFQFVDQILETVRHVRFLLDVQEIRLVLELDLESVLLDDAIAKLFELGLHVLDLALDVIKGICAVGQVVNDQQVLDTRRAVKALVRIDVLDACEDGFVHFPEVIERSKTEVGLLDGKDVTDLVTTTTYRGDKSQMCQGVETADVSVWVRAFEHVE